MNSVLLYVYIGGCAVGILLTAALLTHRRDSSSGNWLALLIFLVSMDELFYSMQHFPQFPFPALIHLSGYAGLLFAPLWFLLVSGQSAVESNPLKRGWHYSFFVICQLVAIMEVVMPSSLPWLTVHNVQDILCCAIMSSYLFAGVLVMKRRAPPQTYCPYFRDCRVAFTCLTAMYAAYLATITTSVFFGDVTLRIVTACSYCVITATLMMLAYSFVHHAIAAVQHDDEMTEPAPSGTLLLSDREKYGNNRLPDFVRESIIIRLTEYMSSEQPWLKIDLTLSELAAAVNLNPHHLSQIINSEFGKSFACFINEYRVNAARRLLSVSDNRTVIEIALDSGFASKSSFNALFKKHTGVTPSEYRRMSRDHSSAERLQEVS